MQTTTSSPLLRLAIIIIITLFLICFRPSAETWAAGGAEMETIDKPLPSAGALAKPMTDKNISPEQERAYEANPEALEAAFRHDEELKRQVAKQEKKERDYVGAVHRNHLRKIGAERRERILERENSFNTIRAAATDASIATAAGSVTEGQEKKILFGLAMFVFLAMIFWKLMFGRKKYVA